MRISHELRTIELEDDDGSSYQVTFDCTYEEFMYGQDADNNRGEWRKELVNFDFISASHNNHEIKYEEVPIEILKRAEKEVWG